MGNAGKDKYSYIVGRWYGVKLTSQAAKRVIPPKQNSPQYKGKNQNTRYCKQ
jgi:hypothetical protein